MTTTSASYSRIDQETLKLNLPTEDDADEETVDAAPDLPPALTPRTIRQQKNSKDSRMVMPVMPMNLAVTCCILNFLLPGLGTFVAAFSVFCCAKTEDFSNSDLAMSFCVAVTIAFFQLVLTPLALFGWIWSCIWGMAFIGVTDDELKRQKRAREDPASTNQVVIVTDQPHKPSGYIAFPFPRRQQPYQSLIEDVSPRAYPSPRPEPQGSNTQPDEELTSNSVVNENYEPKEEKKQTTNHSRIPPIIAPPQTDSEMAETHTPRSCTSDLSPRSLNAEKLDDNDILNAT